MASPTTETGGGHKGRFSRIMARHPEIFCFLFALVFALLSKYTRSHSKQYANQPAPRRFFPASSLVLDFPYGNIGDVGTVLLESEVIFVMYYAPWCAKSLQVRAEFDRAAQYLQDQVQFVGVNCWYPQGQCRQQNNFLGFPVLYFYHTTLNGFKYNGLLTAEYMISFVRLMLYPLTYLRNQQDVAALLASSDNVMVGYFDFHSSPQPPGFLQYYYASMRSIEADPSNVVDYGVITYPGLASHFEMNTTQSVFLVRMLNDTLKYPSQRNFTASALARWCMLLRQQPVVQWLLTSGTKSLQLSREIHKGPAVILFTPAHPLAPLNSHVLQLREVAMTYLNCKNESRIRDTITMTTYLRWASILSHLDTTDTCRKLREKQTSLSHPASQRILPSKKCCLSVSAGNFNACDVCLNYHPIHPLSSQGCHVMASSQIQSDLFLELSLGSYGASSLTCSEAMLNYNPSEYVSFCCDSTLNQHPSSQHPSSTSSLSSSSSSKSSSFQSFSSLHLQPSYQGATIIDGDDYYSRDPFIVNSLRDMQETKCQEYRFQRLYGWYPSVFIPQRLGEPKFPHDFSGAGCGHNKTVHFYAMDSRRSWQFAQRLGLGDIRKANNGSALVLVDVEKEVQYSLSAEKDVSAASIIDFLHNYTTESLPRHLRSYSRESRATCSPLVLPASGQQGAEEVCIHEVNTDNFNQIVMDNKKDVVLLYYAPWCGFCAGFAHIFLSLAKYFHSTQDLVFARLNGDVNDLPWEFTTDIYPAITLYPAKHKMDSVSFPDHMDKTLSNLVQFVHRFSSVAVQIETGFNICSGAACLLSNSDSASLRAQELVNRIKVLSVRARRVQQQIKTYQRHITEGVGKDLGDGESDHRLYKIQLQERIAALEAHQKLLIKMIYKTRLQLTGTLELQRHLKSVPTGFPVHLDRGRSLLASYIARGGLLAEGPPQHETSKIKSNMEQVQAKDIGKAKPVEHHEEL